MEKLNCSGSQICAMVEELIKEDSLVPLYVSGSSMNPFLVSRRDIVWLKKCEYKSLKKGDIILFKRRDSSLVLHRVKKIREDTSMVVCGDAQTQTEIVDRCQLVAKVTEIERKGVKRYADSLYWRFIRTMWSILTPLRPLIMRVWFKVRRIKNKK